MQPQSRFVVLTGHLSNYPLSDLVGILRHQRKTGRLLIEYPKGPATFFFHEGELIDAQLNELTGLQAVCVAMSLPESAFNFNPLVRTTRRSIDHSMQRVVSELLGCWDESALQIDSTATTKPQPALLTTQQSDDTHSLPPGKKEILALPPAPSITIPRRYFFLAASVFVVMIGFSIVIAMNGGFRPARMTAAVSAPTVISEPKQETPIKSEEAAKPVPVTREASKLNRGLEQHGQDNRRSRQQIKEQLNDPGSAASTSTASVERAEGDVAVGAQSVKVVMQIENGRILKASVANHKPGMDSYEALALRIARQRRYPEKVTGEETVRITVSRPN